MNTFSGKQYIIEQQIDESILKTAGAGADVIIKQFMQDELRLKEKEYNVNTDKSVDVVSKILLIKNKKSIPVWIDEAKNIEIVECDITTFKMPRKSFKITIEDCPKLEKITLPEENSFVGELIIKSCDNLDISELSKLNVRKITIYDCGIKSLKGLENVSGIINIKRCKKLCDYDLKNTYNPVINIENCPLRTFSENLCSKDATLTNLKKASQLEIKLGTVEDLRIEDSDELENLTITGNKISTLVVSNCSSLKSIKSIDTRVSSSFVNLPQIENYDLPTISGICVFEKVKTIPDVQCKKILNRNK